MPSGAPQLERFGHGGGTLVDEAFGVDGDRHIVFLHGWGATRESLRGVAVLFEPTHRVHLIDLPGFGEAPPPPADWSTPNYTDLVQQYLVEHVHGTVVLVGHSFGARVAVRLAGRRLAQLSAMVLMAAPGLPSQGLSRARVRRWGVRTLRRLLVALRGLTGPSLLQWHTRRFGSTDYLAAGELRALLVRTVNEDLTESAQAVACPVLLLWGAEDVDTPPWLAYRFRDLMHGQATVEMLPHKDHYLQTSTGAHLCAFKMRGWLEAHAR